MPAVAGQASSRQEPENLRIRFQERKSRFVDRRSRQKWFEQDSRYLFLTSQFTGR
jgi:hypothetical protein